MSAKRLMLYEGGVVLLVDGNSNTVIGHIQSATVRNGDDASHEAFSFRAVKPKYSIGQSPLLI